MIYGIALRRDLIHERGVLLVDVLPLGFGQPVLPPVRIVEIRRHRFIRPGLLRRPPGGDILFPLFALLGG